MAIAFSLTDTEQTFDWSDTIYIEEAMKTIYDKLKYYNPLFQLLSGDPDVIMSSFNRISQLSEEEVITLKLMDLSDQDIEKISKDSMQFKNNIRLLSLGVEKNIPSPIISYNYKGQMLTSVFIYSDSEEYNKENEEINYIRRSVTVFNLAEELITVHLSENYKIPVSKDSTNIFMKRYINISDAKFIFVYYYYLLRIVTKYLTRETIIDILKSRTENPEDLDTLIIPDIDDLTNLLDLVYEYEFDDIPRVKKVDMIYNIYLSCDSYSKIIDNLSDEQFISDIGGNEE